MKKFLSLLLLSVVLTGCTTISNLTPSQYRREASGFYRVEAQWYSDRVPVRTGSFKPVVLVGATNAYPMTQSAMGMDRWEAFIPVPANENLVIYRYKFDFLDNTARGPMGNSMMSKDFELKIK